MARFSLPTALALGLLLGGGGSSAGPVPSVDEATWETIERAAAPTLPEAGAEGLRTAAERFAPDRPALRETLRRKKGALYPQVARETLPSGVRDALAALVAWREGGGGLGPVSCSRKLPVLELRDLATAALASATGLPDPHVDAVLYLAHRLRSAGSSLIEIVSGRVFADEVLDWAESRGVGPWPALRTYAPGDADARRALAVEARCSLLLAEMLRSPDGRAGLEEKLGTGAPFGRMFTRQIIEREINAVRDYQLALFAGAQRRWDDLAALHSWLAGRSAEAAADEGHPLLRTIVTDMSPLVERLRATAKRAAAFLSRADRR